MKILKLLKTQYTISIFCHIHKEFLILNKVSDVIISIHDIANKVLSTKSNYIVDVVM